MRRFKDFFKIKFFGKIKKTFSKSDAPEGTAKYSLKKLGDLVKKRSKNGSNPLNSLQWEKIFSTVFSPESRKKIHQGFIITLIASSTYGVGKIAALMTSKQEIKAKSVTRSSRRSNVATANSFEQDLEQIKKANLFNARESDAEKVARLTKKPVKIDDNNKCTKSNQKSSLPIKLVNTVVLQDSVKSIASVQVRSSRDLVTVRKGDRIQQMAKIGLIKRQKVIFQNLSTGRCEHIENLDLDKPFKVVSPARGKKLISSMKKEGIKNQGNNFTIKKDFRDKLLDNMSDLLTQARAIQIRNPDGTLSYKMVDIVPGSVYSQLNIQDGDIITGFDGKKIKNLNDIMNKFGNIKEIDHVEISVLRNGNEEKLEYNFED